MNIYLIGAGCGSMGTQTLEATEKLEACDLIIGARRLVEGLPERYEGKCISAHKPDIIAQILRNAEKTGADGEVRIGDGGETWSDDDGEAWSDDGAKEKCVVLLLSGDSGFYSRTENMRQKFYRGFHPCSILRQKSGDRGRIFAWSPPTGMTATQCMRSCRERMCFS